MAHVIDGPHCRNAQGQTDVWAYSQHDRGGLWTSEPCSQEVHLPLLQNASKFGLLCLFWWSVFYNLARMSEFENRLTLALSNNQMFIEARSINLMHLQTHS